MRNTQLLLAMTCLGLASASPLAQNGLEQEGYRVRSPTRVPSEIFSVPTVPPAPPIAQAQPVDQLYSTPQQQREQQSSVAEPQVLQQVSGPSIRDQASPPAPPPTQTAQMQGMPYEFEWSVNDVESGLLYSHQENSDGAVAQGEYRVLLPDGRLQIVTFEDRGQGYQAQVTYQDYNL